MNKKIFITLAILIGFIGFLLLAVTLSKNYTPIKKTKFEPIPIQQWKKWSKQEEIIKRGKIQFELRCYKCHGYYGEGNLKGPSLIDEDWVYPTDYNSIYKIVHDGIPEKGKYGNAKKLLLSDIQALTIYVKYLETK